MAIASGLKRELGVLKMMAQAGIMLGQRLGAATIGSGARYRSVPMSKRRPPAPLVWLESVTLLASCLIVWWLSAVFVHPIWSWVALCEFVWLCALSFRLEPRGFALFLPVAITRASVVVALVAIEYGARLPELGLSGTAGPHTTSYVCLTALLFASYLLIFRGLVAGLSLSNVKALTAVFDRFSVAISAVIIVVAIGSTLWLIVIGASRGFPLLVGMDRFVFRRLFADSLTLNILNFKSIIAGVLGLVTFSLRVGFAWKRLSLGVFFVFLGVNFLFGDKFFIIILTVSCFFAPYLYMNHHLARKKLGSLIGLTTLLMLPVLSVTWFIYSDNGRASVAATSQRLTERFAAQGELWYLQTKIGAPLIRWNDQFVDGNIQAMSIKNVDLFALQNGLGPAYFMNRYAPDKLRAAQGRHAGAVTYTMALEPLALVNFGWIGLAVAMVLSAGLFGLAAIYVAYAIERRLMLSMIFSSYVMVLMRTFMNQGTPWVIASVFTLKWFSIVLAIELILLTLAHGQAKSGKRTRRLTRGAWQSTDTTRH